MSEQLEYLIADFDLHLVSGHPPAEAWAKALEDYHHVFHGKEGTQLSRAAERAIEGLDSPKQAFLKLECTCHIVEGYRYPTVGGCPRHSLTDRRGQYVESEIPLGS